MARILDHRTVSAPLVRTAARRGEGRTPEVRRRARVPRLLLHDRRSLLRDRRSLLRDRRSRLRDRRPLLRDRRPLLRDRRRVNVDVVV
jgi:hypothetical protein